MQRKRLVQMVALLAIVALVSGACGKAKKTPGAVEKKGGNVVLGAEQWAECLNPINSCYTASWMHWVAAQHVLPRLMELDAQSNFVASPVLTEAPTIANGGIKDNPFTITYHIRPEAKWDDGTDITSADVEFSWQAHMKTTGTVSTLGYEKITKIDTSVPKTAIITFSEPYADWWDLMGGGSAYFYQKAKFPGGPDLKDAMKDSYGFSGGPFKLTQFTKQQAILVRNDGYWDKDRVSNFDQVTFVPREDQTTEVQSLLTGEVSAIYPQPNVTLAQQLSGGTGVKFKVDAGTTFEGLWFNLGKFPLSDKTVREAFVHAIDRQAVVDTIIKPINANAQVLNCAGWVPNVGPWCNSNDFADITYDVAKAKSLLEAAGWKLGGDGIYAKGGKRLSITFSTTAGNKGREDTQALLKEKTKAAGIELKIQNFPAGVLFENKLPHRDFVMGEYAQVASPDPSVTSVLANDQIPSKANNYSGQNYLGWNNAEATAAMKESDRTVDPAKRKELLNKVGALERQDLPWLPMYQKALITAWRDDKLAGPIGAFTASTYSGFANIYDWYLK